MKRDDPAPAKFQLDLAALPNDQLLLLRAHLEREMRRRDIAFTVGDLGEQLVIEHFNKTAGLPKLQLAPTGTKNVDALSRSGERYSIKTIWKSKKTGTVYPDSNDTKKQLFEYLLVAQLDDDMALKAIYQVPWTVFTELRLWDKRMSAWYLSCSGVTLKKAERMHPRNGNVATVDSQAVLPKE